jgi:alkyldihydroxyacetonephosphate synthase
VVKHSPAWVDELRGLLPDGAVTTEPSELDAHAVDAWPVARKQLQRGEKPYLPDAVARPASTGDVATVLGWAAERRVPVTAWGAGSSVTGAPLPLRGGVVLDMSLMDRVIDLNGDDLLLRVEAGARGGAIETFLNDHGFTLGHSPQSLSLSTVGGWVATRASGQFSSRWGGIEDRLAAMTVVLAGGDTIRTPSSPRGSAGPDLRGLFIGSEGTLGVVTEVVLSIVPLPDSRVLESVVLHDVPAGLRAMREIMRSGLRPSLLRLYDEREAAHAVRDPTIERPILLMGFDGLEPVVRAEQAEAVRISQSEGGEAVGAGPAEAWMERRFDFSYVETVLNSPGGFAETIEVADRWGRIEVTHQELRKVLDGLADHVLGHFSHAYMSGVSLYLIILGETVSDTDAEYRLLQIWDAAMRACLDRGTAITHHHGFGIARLSVIREFLSESIIALERIKDALDPSGIMNPGKLGLGDTT